MQTTKPTQRNHRLIFIAIAIALILLFVAIAVPAFKIISMMTGNYTIDTVQFTLTDPTTATSGIDGSTEPGIWINTNITEDFFNKTIKSIKPYSIGIDKTDSTAGYDAAVITHLKVTYDDNTVETSKPTLPYTITGQDYTSTNSGTGGRIFQTTTYVISGMIPNVITRDEPFTLELAGHFTKRDGSKAPFTIDQHYDVILENTTKPAGDVLQDK